MLKIKLFIDSTIINAFPIKVEPDLKVKPSDYVTVNYLLILYPLIHLKKITAIIMILSLTVVILNH